MQFSALGVKATPWQNVVQRFKKKIENSICGELP